MYLGQIIISTFFTDSLDIQNFAINILVLLLNIKYRHRLQTNNRQIIKLYET